MPNLSRLNNHINEDTEVEDTKENKNFKKIILILGIIAAVLIIGIIIAVVVGKSGNKEISIPDELVGEKRSDVIDILKEDGFIVKEKKDYSDKYEKNIVIKVNPKENAKVKKGSTVTITVSKGKKQITIEDYTGS